MRRLINQNIIVFIIVKCSNYKTLYKQPPILTGILHQSKFYTLNLSANPDFITAFSMIRHQDPRESRKNFGLDRYFFLFHFLRVILFSSSCLHSEIVPLGRVPKTSQRGFLSMIHFSGKNFLCFLGNESME